MSFGRSLYQFLLSSSQAYAKWDLEVSTSIIKNRKKMLFLLALALLYGITGQLLFPSLRQAIGLLESTYRKTER